MVYCNSLDFAHVIFQVHMLTQERISIVLDITKMKKKKVKMYYLLDQKQNKKELAVDCTFGTFLLYVYINHSFPLQSFWWNVVCLYNV